MFCQNVRPYESSQNKYNFGPTTQVLYYMCFALSSFANS